MSKDTTQKYNHFPCECSCHDPSYRYETIPCESCTSSTPSTKDTQIQKQIEEVLKEFDKLYVHKGEDGDDPEDEWGWTIRGSFPAEVKLFLESKLNTIATKSAEAAKEEGAREERAKIADDIIAEIDGHYDNPHLAEILEEYFDMTYQEWEKKQ